ncbi:hypothetical protein [Propioniciclava flava]
MPGRSPLHHDGHARRAEGGNGHAGRDAPRREHRRQPRPVRQQGGHLREATFRFDDEIDAAITTLAQNPSIASIITTHVIPAQRAVDAFAVAKDSQVSGKVVVSLWLDE